MTKSLMSHSGRVRRTVTGMSCRFVTATVNVNSPGFVVDVATSSRQHDACVRPNDIAADHNANEQIIIVFMFAPSDEQFVTTLPLHIGNEVVADGFKASSGSCVPQSPGRPPPSRDRRLGRSILLHSWPCPVLKPGSTRVKLSELSLPGTSVRTARLLGSWDLSQLTSNRETVHVLVPIFFSPQFGR
jgi:hypothetical protein